MQIDKKLIKRGIDVAAAIAGLAATAPIQAVAALAIRFTMGHPVLFRQERPGLNGQIFEMVKFRTMHHVDRAHGRVTDEERLTKLGQLLRSTSVDELPTLWNVLRGDMSIVGPRPLLVEYLPLYSPEQARRHDMRPGLTGLAQVSGRNAVSWDERFRLDVAYVDGWSLRQDVEIVLRTAAAVVKRDGISAEGSVTMPRFVGSPAEPAAYRPSAAE